MTDNDRDYLYLVSRLDNEDEWALVINASQEYLWRKAMRILWNPFNEYLEYKNCGVVYRVIRKKDLKLYTDEPGIEINTEGRI